MRRTDHVALYGRVKINRAWCSDCANYAFVIDGRIQCCGAPVQHEPTRVVRMIDLAAKRIQPGKKKAKLEAQDHRCFYCDRRFGESYFIKGKPTLLRLHWDHKVPFSFSLDNHEDNYVAACHVCNGWKTSFVFDSIEAARVYLAGKWKEHDEKYGYVSVPSLQESLRPAA